MSEIDNKEYLRALDGPNAVSLIVQGSQLAVVLDLAYDWQRYEKGFEEIDLKQRLLYGPKSRAILPKLSKTGRILDPGGRWNVIPFEGGGYFRTVSTPRFDGNGRYIGSDPTSWIVRQRPVHAVMDTTLHKLTPVLQAIIDTAELVL